MKHVKYAVELLCVLEWGTLKQAVALVEHSLHVCQGRH